MQAVAHTFLIRRAEPQGATQLFDGRCGHANGEPAHSLDARPAHLVEISILGVLIRETPGERDAGIHKELISQPAQDRKQATTRPALERHGISVLGSDLDLAAVFHSKRHRSMERDRPAFEVVREMAEE